MKKYFCINVLILVSSVFISLHAQDETVVSGRVLSKETGRPLHGVNIKVVDTHLGAVTDTSGCFKLLLMSGRHVLTFSHIGYEINTQRIALKRGDGTISLNIQLKPKVIQVDPVSVSARAEQPRISKHEIQRRDIAGIATPLPDAMQTIKTLPGVFSVNDESNFYNIRGGSYDDNLIRLNGVEIYQPLLVRKGVAENPSLVNPWLVQSINLHSSSYPVSWGDKLSSALDIDYRLGGSQQFKGMAALSTVKAEAALEGPLGNIGAFIVAARKIDYGYIFSGSKTKGDYNPDFKDIQVNAVLHPSEHHSIHVFGLMSRSQYRLKPMGYTSYAEPVNHQYIFTSRLTGKEAFDHHTDLASLKMDICSKGRIKSEPSGRAV